MRLQEHRADFESRGIAVVGASMDDPGRARAARSRWGLAFPLLADPEGRCVDALGIRHPGGGARGDTAVPTLIACDAGGRVLWTHQGEYTHERLHPSEALARFDAAQPA